MRKICSVLIFSLILILSLISCNTSSKESPVSDFEYQISQEKNAAIIIRYTGDDKVIVVPKKIEGCAVKYISFNAFANSPIEQITLPDTVEEIYDGAFSNCKNLHTVDLGKGLKTIQQEAFRKCVKLENIILPNGLTTIKYEAFFQCESLKEITIPKTVSKIGESAFCYSALSSIVFEDGIKSIGSYSSFWSSADIESITIPASVKEIKEYTFNNKLKQAVFLGDAPETLGSHPFDETTVIYYDKNTSGWENTELNKYKLIAK